MIEEARGLALRKGPWKYIPGKSVKVWEAKKKGKQPKTELYNLDSDPGEQKNLVDEKPQVAKEMAELLEKLKNAEGGVRKIGG